MLGAKDSNGSDLVHQVYSYPRDAVDRATTMCRADRSAAGGPDRFDVCWSVLSAAIAKNKAQPEYGHYCTAKAS